MKQRKASVANVTKATAQQNAVSADAGSVGQTPFPEQAKPQLKTVALKSGKLPQIFRCLSALGFKSTSPERYVNSSPEANIQEIVWERDRIDHNCAWISVSARKPFACPTASMQRFARHRQADLERKLRLAKEYWLRIQPYIKDRPLQGAELFIATVAHFQLSQAAGQAATWNVTVEGQGFAVPADAMPDFGKDQFLEPMELCRGENLKPETLAAIAAPMMQKRMAELTPFAVIGVAHELLLAAERYVKALPEQKRGPEGVREAFARAFGTVTFDEIKASNAKSSGQLPLLPSSGQKRNGVSEQEQGEEPLSISAIRAAVRRYLSENEMPLEDCMTNSRISLQDLCRLRWERFERGWSQRQLIASNRKPRQ